jgi:predicted GIY-YIG superfamily endonuclease
MDKKHYVYILKCADGTYYTGYTTDPERRTQVHNSGKGAKYTRARRPVELIYTEEYDDKIEAHRREYSIKQLTRAEKEKLMYEKKIEEYAAKAKERWGDTDAFKEYEKKSAGRNAEEHRAIADQMMDIFAEFGKIKDSSPESEEAVVLVRKLQDFITEHYYQCTDEILGSLGEAYGAGGEFTKNINDAAGDGAAEFASKAIACYLA